MEEMQHFPESYRKAMLSHHQRVRKDLSPFLILMNEPLQVANLNQLVPLLLSIPLKDRRKHWRSCRQMFEVYTDWAIGRKTLKHKLLYRFNAALSGMLKKVVRQMLPFGKKITMDF